MDDCLAAAGRSKARQKVIPHEETRTSGEVAGESARAVGDPAGASNGIAIPRLFELELDQPSQDGATFVHRRGVTAAAGRPGGEGEKEDDRKTATHGVLAKKVDAD